MKYSLLRAIMVWALLAAVASGLFAPAVARATDKIEFQFTGTTPCNPFD